MGITTNKEFQNKGMYIPETEHDACGMGFVADISGRKSHQILKEALEVLVHMEHRGAIGADPKTGDGAGVLTQIPHEFFVKVLKPLNIELPVPGEYGVGMIFLPKGNEKNQKKLLNIFEKNCKKAHLEILGYRDVPTDNSDLGEGSLSLEPDIKQVFVKIKKPGKKDKLDIKLYLTRRRTEIQTAKSNIPMKDDFYFASFASSTIVYKGMLLAEQVEKYYLDLQDQDYKVAIATMHSRFATNVLPKWKLAQPFRYLSHNGEINTVIGNRKWLRARESAFKHPEFGQDLKDVYPVTSSEVSDTASLDNAMEFFGYMGREIPHVLMMMIPEVWEGKDFISEEKKAFYEYHAMLMEPWDGPAAIVSTDGVQVGAVLDRNGLRPSRYIITKSGKLIVSSEVGALNIDPADIKKSGRLQPGMMLLLDTKEGRIIEDNEIKNDFATRHTYKEWLNKHKKTLDDFTRGKEKEFEKGDELFYLQRVFGYTDEDKTVILKDMIEMGKEPIGSMGNDTPLSVLSNKPKLLFTYFKQLFAQVTNPPIDPIRESCVMSLVNFLGQERNILFPDEYNARRIKIQRPVLTKKEFHKIEAFDSDFKSKTLSVLFKAQNNSLEKAVEKLCTDAIKAINDGYDIIILSDRGVSKEMAAIPALLAVSAVHIYTVRAGIRKRASIILESAEIREVDHYAVLAGFGCDAVYPYLAYATVESMIEEGEIDVTLTKEQGINNYIKAIDAGLLKIFSKMGISTFQSYQAAQIFEPIGLKMEFVEKYFEGVKSRIGGIGIEELEQETLMRHNQAYLPTNTFVNILDWGGEYQWKRHGEYHLWNPETIFHMQQAIRTPSVEHWDKFSELINNQKGKHVTLRSLLKFKKAKPVPIDEVEPASEIVKRFCVSAMSFGSISKEAHETMVIAMNKLGAMSNSGEGGEDPIRFKPYPNGDFARSTVKQVASGRFGVTSHYLVNGTEMQIKMAQGAKPGEGGHLPGHKVNEVIASVRNSMPGVSLISPPPHHDIYSIEDLAQLIYDLKNVNPDNRVSVKLVSEIGVGTIAAGVAKGHADMILISGYDGGTGASPQSSIKHAGLPWELGISETHQVLIMNKLRSRVRLQVDGQLRTGRDVVIGAMLGAEEFGFGTASLIAVGCVMMRKCQKNLCPVGIATQRPELRKKFAGNVDHVVNYFMFVAEEARKIMGELGIRKFDELIGRTDLLELKDTSWHFKAKGIDLSRILYMPEVKSHEEQYCNISQDHGLEHVLDRKLIKLAQPAIQRKEKVNLDFEIKNINRATGTMLGGEISKKHGKQGLPEETITVNFEGYAGQSFGAFLVNGITFNLHGQANDYVGKGMSGGRIVIRPHEKTEIVAEENIIVGNTLLYGATGGEVFIRGVAGERFAVRNSGCYAVVEGIGDHGCEYMTGGRVVILGNTGINFGAGMSGGIAYVLDENGDFKSKVNKEMIDFEELSAGDEKLIIEMIEKHYKYTKSDLAKRVLSNQTDFIKKFVKIMPIEYKRVLEERETIERAKGA